MNPKLKILCLSFRTPPKIRPQSILIGKMIPEWIKQGLEPIIITYSSNGNWDINTPVYYIDEFKISKTLSRIIPLRWLKRKVYQYQIIKKSLKIIHKHQPDLIFSFSNPQESNILGAQLKRKTKIPFISHFSDPWYDNPYEKSGKLRKRIILNKEKFIFQNSDQIIFTNQQAQNLIMKKYPAEWFKKTAVIPHCYNIGDYQINRKENENFIFSYIGAFYPERNPKIFFQALSKIINPDLKKKISLELVGVANDYAGYSLKKIKKLLEEYQIKDITKIIPPVSYQESLNFMTNSNCLLVIDANFKNSPFLPSKLIDYAGSNNLIIGITPSGSPTEIFLNNLGYKSFNYEQVDDLANYLSKLINKEVEVKVNREYLERFAVQNTTKRLIEKFN